MKKLIYLIKSIFIHRPRHKHNWKRYHKLDSFYGGREYFECFCGQTSTKLPSDSEYQILTIYNK